MLPLIQKEEYLYQVPKFNFEKKNIYKYIPELRGFHEQFAECFRRSEPREHFFNYMTGQFSKLDRKSIEPIALTAGGGNVRAMQRFVSDGNWDDHRIGLKHRSLVNEDLGCTDGALILGGNDFLKKGNASIGVARQYCRSIGKVDNCQLGIFAAYASEHGYSLVDKRLFLPREWFTYAYKKRREKCAMPKDIVFRTKSQLAADMIKSLTAENILPTKYILGDATFGKCPDFIEAAEQTAGITYLVSVPEDTLCRPIQPLLMNREYDRKGKVKTKTAWKDSACESMTLSVLARNINAYHWYRRQVSEGVKGPVGYEFTRRRIILSSKGFSNKAVWVLIRRTIGDDPQYCYFVSNAALNIRLEVLIWLSGMRWALEQCFEETRIELGLDQYEVRKFKGWHHHMLTCMLAHFFLWHLKIRLGKKSTIHYAVAA